MNGLTTLFATALASSVFGQISRAVTSIPFEGLLPQDDDKKNNTALIVGATVLTVAGLIYVSKKG